MYKAYFVDQGSIAQILINILDYHFILWPGFLIQTRRFCCRPIIVRSGLIPVIKRKSSGAVSCRGSRGRAPSLAVITGSRVILIPGRIDRKVNAFLLVDSAQGSAICANCRR